LLEELFFGSRGGRGAIEALMLLLTMKVPVGIPITVEAHGP
jgi:hypothetical protein